MNDPTSGPNSLINPGHVPQEACCTYGQGSAQPLFLGTDGSTSALVGERRAGSRYPTAFPLGERRLCIIGVPGHYASGEI
ncbi:hypothetical protein UY3_14313 [Chelonia mydas]|uniref:Uncharacterized protein n=1 Tax=Chelonia mydas TaxID=8469 RepID=M7AT94_CHEMY|nr:hypothetical protein UY3_14313 [Chelonia mydas]